MPEPITSRVTAINRPAAHARNQAEYRVSITLEVTDLESLWHAAARVIARTGTSMDDVYDTIGCKDDPNAADCIATLLAPGIIPGAELDDFWVDQLAAPRRGAVDTHPIVAKAPRGLSERAGRPFLHVSVGEDAPTLANFS